MPMIDQMTIDISGLSKAEILAALFNASSPAGVGFVQAEASPDDMTVEQAEGILQQQTDFGYLGGRSFKVDLSGDTLNPWLYDRDNGGEGTAERIIQRLRETGAVSSTESATNREVITTQRAYDQPDYAELGRVLGPHIAEVNHLMGEIVADGMPVPPDDVTPRQYLDWASDQALSYYDRGQKEKAILLFIHLVRLNENTAWIASHEATPMLLMVGLMGDRHQMEHQMKGFAA